MQPSTYSSALQGTPTSEVSSSGVSWGAVIGGAVVAAALALCCLRSGRGSGFPPSRRGRKRGRPQRRSGIATIVWLALMQFVASRMGGYLAGRLRTQWVDVHTDEDACRGRLDCCGPVSNHPGMAGQQEVIATTTSQEQAT